MTEKKYKTIGMFSGGLDSILATKRDESREFPVKPAEPGDIAPLLIK